jgi:hypothetical protein
VFNSNPLSTVRDVGGDSEWQHTTFVDGGSAGIPVYLPFIKINVATSSDITGSYIQAPDHLPWSGRIFHNSGNALEISGTNFAFIGGGVLTTPGSDATLKNSLFIDLAWIKNTYVMLGASSGVFANNVAFIALIGLPTSDPLRAGALWNNSGTVTVSAG